MQYVCIRVNSTDKNTTRPEDALPEAEFQSAKICVEHTGTEDTNRLRRLPYPGQLRSGDPLLHHSVDHPYRNMADNYVVTTRLRNPGATAHTVWAEHYIIVNDIKYYPVIGIRNDTKY